MKTVLVCQNRTCLKQGAAAVLAALQAQQCGAFGVEASGCMGQCGNGVMVRVLPDDIWYWRVRPEEVPALIDRHLIAGIPITAMVFPIRYPYSGY